MLADYNLRVPKSERQAPHDCTGDPMFIDPGKGLFWLRTESPAHGKGSPDQTPDTDFWGRPRPRSQASDLGALPFVPELAKPAARARFEGGWTYYRHGSGGTLPDFWALPLTT